MKKKTVHLLLSLTLLAAMGLLYLKVKNFSENEQKEDSESVEQEESAELLSFPKDSIQSVKFLSDGKEVVFVKEKDTWKKEDEPEFPLDQDIVENAVSSMEYVEAQYVIGEVEDLSQYDLQTPANIITLSDTDGIETKIEVGLENESGQYYICKADDEKTVYLIDGSVVDPFMKKMYDYTKINELPTIESDTIKCIKVEKNDTGYELQKNEDALWYVKGEGAEEADTTKMDSLLYKIAALSYESLVNYHSENDAEYGLEQPYAVLSVDYQTEEVLNAQSIQTETEEAEIDEMGSEEADASAETVLVDQTLVLYIGDSTGDGFRYVKTEGSNEIYTMSETSLENLLEASAKDFWNLSVFYLSINDLDTLKVEYDGETNICNVSRETSEENEEKNSEETQDTHYFIDGAEVDYLNFSSFYNKLVDFKASERLTEGIETEKTACFTAEFTDLDGTIEKMEIFEFDEDFDLILMNDKYYLVNKMTVKDMINAFERR